MFCDCLRIQRCLAEKEIREAAQEAIKILKKEIETSLAGLLEYEFTNGSWNPKTKDPNPQEGK